MTDKLKTVLFFVALTAIGATLVIQLYPKVHPLAGIRQKVDAKTIEGHAQGIVDELGLNEDGYSVTTRFGIDRDLIRQAQAVFGLQESNRIFREGLPAHHWRVDWNSTEDRPPPRGRDDDVGPPPASWFGELSMTFDMQGNLLRLASHLADTISLPALEETEARRLAEKFIVSNSALTVADSLVANEFADGKVPQIDDQRSFASQLRLQEQKRTIGHSRTDYQFTYVANDRYLHDVVRVTVLVSGNMVSRFDVEPIVPERFRTEGDGMVSNSTRIISILVFIILIAIIGFRKIRAYEIGFRTAIFFGVLVGLSFGLNIYLNMRESPGWGMLAGLTLVPFSIGLVFTVVWAVAESVGREVWKEKFVGLDLLTNGHLSHSKIGEGILRGIGLGLILPGIGLLMLWLASNVTDIFTFPIQDNDNFLSMGNSALFVVNDAIGNNAFKAAIYLTLAASLLRKIISPTATLVVLVAVVWGFVVQGNVRPWYIGIPIEAVIGGLLAITFIRFDFITLFISLFTFTIVDHGTSFFYFDNQTAMQSGYGLLVFMSALAAIGFVFLSTKDNISDFSRITPAFVQHVTERQRLQSELAVAREVQMSFLPTDSPRVAGLDIVSECLPANEVGGDYYDFIELGKKKIGIVVGDVSGKGTQAAFYMTLTKGFLKALAHTTSSPARLLIQMNQLFYENVKRGHFISLIYAVFDLESRTATIARAGHNPIVVKQASSGKVEFFDQPGIAMGLEKGTIFKTSVDDRKIPFATGDLFAFYTDGLTEAMNKNKEEFGELRFLESVTRWSAKSAAELQKGVFADVKNFTGRAAQQDDMTMVVVKIT